ncbi:Cytosolic sulfotransferase 2 [Larimichthys crocea]|uniref:Cytosolic sulfotransferase 2 n=1 Tax=Larimichthys crocea TaxID=215358 RepID=A0A6G0IQY2_LARCR|nr:Cytosolic sulfotransferase 2 [Larimichthys crocea]
MWQTSFPPLIASLKLIYQSSLYPSPSGAELGEAVVVYVARNAKDSVVSYFHFQRMTLIFPEPGEWSSYLQRFMKGKMVFGSWYDHVNGWWKKKQSYSKLHFMFYEDMIEDIGREIDKLCSFLGLSPSAEEKERIIDSVQFDKMKTNDMVNFSGVEQMNLNVSSFIRKGKVGDWKNHFTVAQNEEFDEDYGEKMKDSTLQFRISMTKYNTDNWENAQNFQARPNDVIIASYPKAGGTWLSYILDLLYFGQLSPERQTSIPIYRRAINLELAMPYSLPVYVARNAKDSVVSYFHFQRMTLIFPEPGEWSSYLQRFMKGKMVFGSWYDHVNGWWKKKQSYSKLHFMFYEDMIEDIGREMDKLCSFLGLSPSAEEKERIIDSVQFDKMKTNDMVNFSGVEQMNLNVSSFIRKGKVGDWKNHFTVAQNEEFDEDYGEKMKDSTLQFRSETTHIFRGTEMLDKLPTSPRLIKTHLPVQLMPNSFWEQNCKVVYVARNAKDSVVSYFHFQRMTLIFPEPGEWSSYLQRFMKGKMVFGSWYDHVNGWWKKKQSYSKLHFMFYEDMIEDIGREMDKLCSFLGLSPSAEEKERIIDSVQFDKMKTNDMVNFSGVEQMNLNVSSFIRKGKVGDWKNHFTVAQNEEFDEDYGEKMKDSTLQFLVFGSWYDHVNGWWKKKQSYSKLHFMFYEDMIEDIGREMDKLCSFLGLSPSAEEKERIIDSVQFDEMKSNDMVNFSGFKQMNFKVSSFIRKGKVGDWKNHFTVAQNEEFDEDYGEKMKDSTLQFRTEV